MTLSVLRRCAALLACALPLGFALIQSVTAASAVQSTDTPAAPLVAGMADEEVLRLGELMYRDGVLPSGEPMKAFVADDVPVDGTSFTCVSCHLRSGMGSIEGEVITPPTNGPTLYKERHPYIEGQIYVPSIHNYAVYLPERPAYTDDTLATLLTTGIDPTGRSVIKAMPRYEIDGRDLEIMIAYLKQLSDRPSPGVSKNHIDFATVIVDGADPLDVESMLLPIQFSVDRKNSLVVASQKNDRVARMGYNMLGDLHSVTFSLDQWHLSGPPESWRAQLDAYYAKKPVFALLGGISPGTWEPIHQFCEAMKIPELFPIVDAPVLNTQDWYTQYLSRGTRQEGEAAARYLSGMAELFGKQAVVQIVRDTPRGRELADGFRSIWTSRGHEPPIEIVLAKDEPFNGLQLQRVVAKHSPAALLVWDDDKALGALAGLVGLSGSPGFVIASGTWMKNGLKSIPEDMRSTLYFTWPYRMPQDELRFEASTRKVMAGKRYEDFNTVIIRQSYMTQEILGKALMEMRSEYYRDFLLDTIGMMDDQYLPLYERVSFGPGQRYASKGCYITQVGKGKDAQLERRSEWDIP